MGRFQPAPAVIDRVETCDAPAFTQNQKRKGAKRQGQLYEERVCRGLRKMLGRQFVRGPWLRFYSCGSKPRICQPDGIYIDKENKIVTVIEVKYTFVDQAWRQINQLYMPVVQAFRPDYTVRGVQVFHNFDASVRYPVKPSYVNYKKIGDSSWRNGNKVCLWKI